MDKIVAWWSVLLPNSKEVMGLIPGLGPYCVELHAVIVSAGLSWGSPTIQ